MKKIGTVFILVTFFLLSVGEVISGLFVVVSGQRLAGVMVVLFGLLCLFYLYTATRSRVRT